MGTVIGLILGAGLACLWWSCWEPEPRERTTSRLGLRLRDTLTQAGVRGVGPGAFAAVSLGLALVIAVVATAVTSSVTIGAAFGLMSTLLPSAYVQARARARRKGMRALWPDVVDDLTSAIRAGLSLPDALMALADRGPAALREDFAEFAADYRATGRFDDALDRLKARLADPVADRLIEALRLTREVGGTDLGRLLRTLSQFLREDLRTRAELEARQSWTVNGAKLAAFSPWLVLALMSTRGDAARAFDTGAGVLVLAVGAALTVIAYLLMVRLGRLPEEARVLR